ncbi:MAG: hypothetical protein ACE14V_02835 [bacterium]
MSALTPKEYNIIYLFCSPYKKFTHLSQTQQTQFIQQAVETGRQIAEAIQQEYQNTPLTKLLNRLDIRIEYDQQHRQIGNMVVRAKYTGNPPTITIYRRTIQSLADTNKAKLNIEDFEEIAIAHELYHHLAVSEMPKAKCQMPNIESRKTAPGLFDELAAQSFTQHFLKLDFIPLTLDMRIDFI